MAIRIRSRSHLVSLIAVFAAMVAVLDSIPIIPGFYSGVWASWIFLLSPLIGVLLGPFAGAVAVGVGTFVGHIVYFRDPYEFVFMFGAPVGAGMAGFVSQKRWKPVLSIYTLLLLAYFLTPVAWVLPLFGIWDILFGYLLVVLFSFLGSRNFWPRAQIHDDFTTLAMSTVIGLESDILFRIFILIPCQTYWLFYGLTPEQLQLIWLGAGFVTPLKVALAAVTVLLIGLPLLRQLAKEGTDQE